MPFTLATVFILATTPAASPTCLLPNGWQRPIVARAAIGATLRYALKDGQAVNLGLAPATRVKFAMAPGRKAKTGSYAGLAAFDVRTAGTIAIALSEPAYVDVIRDGNAIASSAHREGCGGVRKIVSFPVVPGRYLIQLADAPSPRIRMLISQ
jgi:hypothetical protein